MSLAIQNPERKRPRPEGGRRHPDAVRSLGAIQFIFDKFYIFEICRKREKEQAGDTLKFKIKGKTEPFNIQGTMAEQLKKGGMTPEDAAAAKEAIGKALFKAKGHK